MLFFFIHSRSIKRNSSKNVKSFSEESDFICKELKSSYQLYLFIYFDKSFFCEKGIPK